MPNNDATREESLARLLLDLTEAAKIEWRKTDQSNAFAYIGDQASAVISSDMGGPILRILDSDGDTVASMVYSSIAVEPVENVDRQRKLLRNLLEAARRSALNVDQVISAFETELRTKSE